MISLVAQLVASVLAAQAAPPAAARLVPGMCEASAAENPGAYGCYLTVALPLGPLDAPVWWHLVEFDTEAAARAAAPPRSAAVTRSYGRWWLHAFASEGWRPSGGKRHASVGPLALNDTARPAVARLMEARAEPFRQTRPHRHSGPEAFYMLEGAQCLETPGRRSVVREGATLIVPEGAPMQLSGYGGADRRTLLVVLHDADRPWMSVAADWTPEGLCATGPPDSEGHAH